MGLIDKKKSSFATEYIIVDVRNCVACWKCVDACPTQAIGKIKILWHKHVKFSNPKNCIGCGKCVKACPNGLFSFKEKGE